MVNCNSAKIRVGNNGFQGLNIYFLKVQKSKNCHCEKYWEKAENNLESIIKLKYLLGV